MRAVPGVGVGGGLVVAPVVALDDVEPVLDVVEGLVADVVDVGAVVAGVGVAFYEAGVAQDAEVLADERLAASEGVGEPDRGARLVRERPDDPLAHTVGEQVQRGHDGWLGPPVVAGGCMSFRLCTAGLWFTRIACSYAAFGRLAVVRRIGFVPQGGHFLPFLIARAIGAAARPADAARRRLSPGTPEIDIPFVGGAIRTAL
jgi:hypothetical protein